MQAAADQPDGARFIGHVVEEERHPNDVKHIDRQQDRLADSNQRQIGAAAKCRHRQRKRHKEASRAGAPPAPAGAYHQEQDRQHRRQRQEPIDYIQFQVRNLRRIV